MLKNYNIFLNIKILYLGFFKLFRIKDKQHNEKTTMYKFSVKEDE